MSRTPDVLDSLIESVRTGLSEDELNTFDQAVDDAFNERREAWESSLKNKLSDMSLFKAGVIGFALTLVLFTVVDFIKPKPQAPPLPVKTTIQEIR